jgi:hypothetical protein
MHALEACSQFIWLLTEAVTSQSRNLLLYRLLQLLEVFQVG